VAQDNFLHVDLQDLIQDFRLQYIRIDESICGGKVTLKGFLCLATLDIGAERRSHLDVVFACQRGEVKTIVSSSIV